jgi:hypothetical protein
MALLVPVKGPGGFVAPDGYRRLLGLSLDFVNHTADVTAIDYRSAEARQTAPHDPVAKQHWHFDAKPNPPSQRPSFDPNGSGKMIIEDIGAIPGVEDFLAQPISALLPSVSEATSIRDLLGAIAYGFVKTRDENASATDA